MPQLSELMRLDNLNDPVPFYNHKAFIDGIVISSLLLTTLCVSLRLWVRFLVTRTPGYDDYCVVLTFSLVFASNIGCCLLAMHGLGQHFLVLGIEGMAKFIHNVWWALALYNMALALVKLSLLLQYLRIIDERPEIRQQFLRITVFIMIVVVTAWGLAQSLLAWVPCNPVWAYWADGPVTRPEHQCWGYGSKNSEQFIFTFYQNSASNMILDIVVLAIPMFSKALWATAEADKRSRRGMFGLFVLGGLTVTSSVVRFASQVSRQAGTHPSFDPSFYGTATSVLSILEVNLATIACALPVFWPHLRREIASILVTHEVEVKITRQSNTLGNAARRASSLGMPLVEGRGADDLEGAWGSVAAARSASAADAPGRARTGNPWDLPNLTLRGDVVSLTELDVDGKSRAATREESPELGRSDTGSRWSTRR